MSSVLALVLDILCMPSYLSDMQFGMGPRANMGAKYGKCSYCRA